MGHDKGEQAAVLIGHHKVSRFQYLWSGRRQGIAVLTPIRCCCFFKQSHVFQRKRHRESPSGCFACTGRGRCGHVRGHRVLHHSTAGVYVCVCVCAAVAVGFCTCRFCPCSLLAAPFAGFACEAGQVHAGASFVHAIDHNEDAIACLHINLRQNGVAERCTVYHGDNRSVRVCSPAVQADCSQCRLAFAWS